MLVAALAAAFKFTDWGVAMRSAAEDGETAALMGIRLNRVAAGAWALAGALAAVGGLFLTSFPAAGRHRRRRPRGAGRDPRRRARRLRLAGGRRGRRPGHRRRVGADAPATRTSCRSSAAASATVAPYVVMLLVLLVRPSGLFGTRELTRV